MAKKILFLCGSPRAKGNTRTVVDWAAEAARGTGAEVEVVDCTRLESKATGCVACMRCQAGGEFRCAIDDEVSSVVAQVTDFDVIVFATPVYFFGPTAQLKAVLDRMYSLIKHDPENNTLEHGFAGKRIAAISTAGGDVGSGLNVLEQIFKTMAGFLSVEFVSLLVPFAPRNEGEMTAKADVKEQAIAFGAQLAG